MKRLNQRLRRDEGAITMETVIGIVLLLVVGMAIIQLIMIAQAVTTARTAVTTAARAYAVTGVESAGRSAYSRIVNNSWKSLAWDSVTLTKESGRVKAKARVRVPVVVPGGGLLGGGGLTGPLFIEETGEFPLPEHG